MPCELEGLLVAPPILDPAVCEVALELTSVLCADASDETMLLEVVWALCELEAVDEPATPLSVAERLSWLEDTATDETEARSEELVRLLDKTVFDTVEATLTTLLGVALADIELETKLEVADATALTEEELAEESTSCKET